VALSEDRFVSPFTRRKKEVWKPGSAEALPAPDRKLPCAIERENRDNTSLWCRQIFADSFDVSNFGIALASM
jgi:hypothetical protein